MIYFLTDFKDDVTKIGFTDRDENPIKRIRELQTGNARELILELFIQGGEELEDKFHKLFNSSHFDREWFVRSGPIAEFIQIFKFISWHKGIDSTAINYAELAWPYQLERHYQTVTDKNHSMLNDNAIYSLASINSQAKDIKPVPEKIVPSEVKDELQMNWLEEGYYGKF